MANIAKAIEPKSDQQNAVDYLSGPRVFTIAGTSDYRDDKGRAKVSIHLVEAPDRPFKPSATNLRLIVIGWGQDDTTWPGRRIKLTLDPNVTFGGEKVGGIRVVALSDLEQPFTAKLPTTRGKKAEFRVEKMESQPTPGPQDPARQDAYTRLTAAFEAAGIPKEQRSREAIDWAASEWDKQITSPSDLTVEELGQLAGYFEGLTKTPEADAVTGEVLDWDAAEVGA